MKLLIDYFDVHREHCTCRLVYVGNDTYRSERGVDCARHTETGVRGVPFEGAARHAPLFPDVTTRDVELRP